MKIENIVSLAPTAEVGPPEQQEKGHSLGQEESEPPLVKEEQEHVWSSQEGEQLQGLEEAEIIKFTFSPVSVKSERDEEEAQSSQLDRSLDHKLLQIKEEQEEYVWHLEEVDGPKMTVPPFKSEDGSENTQSSQRPQIKDEPGQDAEEDDVTATVLPVKCEDRQENALPFQPLHTQRQKPIEAEPLPTTSAEPDGEDWDTSEPASYSDAPGSEPTKDERILFSDDSGAESDDSDIWKDSERILETMKSKHTTSESRATGQTLSTRNKFMRSREFSHELVSPNQTLSTTCCKICEMSFPDKISLNKHVNEHPGECGLCGKRLEPTESLKLHLEAHGICTICGKGFLKNIDIVTHMKSHSVETPFNCAFCGKGFKWKGHLQGHMRGHTGEKPFVCFVCGKGFSRSGTVKIHMRTHTDEKPFHCSVCGKCFRQREHLKTHMRMHSNEKPFACALCSKRFRQSEHLKAHIRTHAD